MLENMPLQCFQWNMKKTSFKSDKNFCLNLKKIINFEQKKSVRKFTTD